jgi:hypothetical protein
LSCKCSQANIALPAYSDDRSNACAVGGACFQKTRNAQVLYSVAGTDEGKKDWDKKPAARA